MTDKIIYNKSTEFALRIIKLYKYLSQTKDERVLSKQFLRSGTSIGANVREATYAQSKKDFLNKMNIALKEAAETEYWLELIYKSEYISKKEYESINSECVEIFKLLHAIVKSTKNTI